MRVDQTTAKAATASSSAPAPQNQARGTRTGAGAAATAAVQSAPVAAAVTSRASAEGRRGKGAPSSIKASYRAGTEENGFLG